MKRFGGVDVTHAITAGTQLKVLKESSNMFLTLGGFAIYPLACHNSSSKQLHTFYDSYSRPVNPSNQQARA